MSPDCRITATRSCGRRECSSVTHGTSRTKACGPGEEGHHRGHTPTYLGSGRNARSSVSLAVRLLDALARLVLPWRGSPYVNARCSRALWARCSLPRLTTASTRVRGWPARIPPWSARLEADSSRLPEEMVAPWPGSFDGRLARGNAFVFRPNRPRFGCYFFGIVVMNDAWLLLVLDLVSLCSTPGRPLRCCRPDPSVETLAETAGYASG